MKQLLGLAIVLLVLMGLYMLQAETTPGFSANLPLVEQTGVVTPPGPTEFPRLDNDYLAPVALFCASDGGIDIYLIVEDVGDYLTTVTDEQIVRAIARSQSSGSNTRILNTDTVDFWALASGELQVNYGDYVHTFSYENACGALPDASALQIAPTRRPPGIINQPG
jgi:hypothetical protein